MTKSETDPRIEGLIILPCVNHILNLVLCNPSKETKNLRCILNRSNFFNGLCVERQPFASMGKSVQNSQKTVGCMRAGH
jgi:hypothetical protein